MVMRARVCGLCKAGVQATATAHGVVCEGVGAEEGCEGVGVVYLWMTLALDYSSCMLTVMFTRMLLSLNSAAVCTPSMVTGSLTCGEKGLCVLVGSCSHEFI